MDNRTVWIINQYAGSPYHGMEFRHYYLAVNLQQLGYKVFIVSGSYSHLYAKSPAVKERYTFEKIDGLTYCWIRLPHYTASTGIGRVINMFVFAFRLFFLPEKEMDIPSHIVVSSPSLFPILPAYFMKKRFRAKLVFEIRDVWPLSIQVMAGMKPSHPFILFMRFFESFGYKKSDQVVSVLPGAYKHIKKFKIRNPEIPCIPNGVDIKDYENSEPLPEEMLALIPKNKFIVGYVGTMGKANALNDLASAIELLRPDANIFFVFVGSGNEKQSVQQLTAGNPNVLFLPSIGKRQVQSALALFDICYIGWKKDTLYEFGISANKIFDYMYAGKPIVHAVSAYNDPIAEAQCGLSVEAENVQQIAAAIKELSSFSKEELHKMGSRGREYVISKHSYAVLAKQYSSILN